MASMVSAPGATDFQLQTLGWKAFQDLCGTILSEILGQTYLILEPGKDGGRDGGFRGSWKQEGQEELAGAFTVQCKFTTSRNKTLALSDLSDEIEKARRLRLAGFADAYLLMTNARVTARTLVAIEHALAERAGISQVRVFGSAWINQKIRESDRLRMLVPRIYGIGDLSQIIDQRAYAQAQKLLVSLQDELGKFVRTTAYTNAAEALDKHRFVFLIGEPASGKSTIAATLALAATDRWQTQFLKLQDANEFSIHWNPEEPNQFFWVDDVFGATQYQPRRADDWNQAFPKLYAAMRGGARVVFTSRDYIWRQAQGDLKVSSFPPLAESQVFIRVEELSNEEREDILYNHVKLGDQPKLFKTAIKPFLRELARSPAFAPEFARRIGTRAFTKETGAQPKLLLEMMERKQGFLVDLLRSLGIDERAALAMLFMSASKMISPLNFDERHRKALDSLGSSPAKVSRAFQTLKGGFVRMDVEDEGRYWTFKHPTIRDAVAVIVRDDEELLEIYLEGASDDEVLAEVVCGEVELPGSYITLDVSHYTRVMSCLHKYVLGDLTQRRAAYAFLARRCSSTFLRHFLESTPGFLESLPAIGATRYEVRINVMATLSEHGLLPEKVRVALVEAIGELAIEVPDADWTEPDGPLSLLMTDDERSHLLRRVYDELVPQLEDVISDWRMNCGEYVYEDAEDYYAPLVRALEKYGLAFENSTDLQDGAIDVSDAITRVAGAYDELPSREDVPRESPDRPVRPTRLAPSPSRDRFDDVDA